MSAPQVDANENKRKMQAGELYYAFTQELIDERNRCRMALGLYNKSDNATRREQVELYQSLVADDTPMPKRHHMSSEEHDESQFEDFPMLLPPVTMDYGYNVNGTHPLDPTVRNGTRGPESGKPITIGEDCWLGGNVIVLPGVTIGKGSTVGAGSVVTKDVEPYTCVAGNPARVIRKIEVGGGAAQGADAGGVEVLAGEEAHKVDG